MANLAIKGGKPLLPSAKLSLQSRWPCSSNYAIPDYSYTEESISGEAAKYVGSKSIQLFGRPLRQ